jgi:hypothetical protein
MFGFFKKQLPHDPPTDKQRKYASYLGLIITSDMSKSDVSAAISDAACRNLDVASRRKRVKAKARLHKFGKELIDQETRWNQFADDPEFMLAVYKRGKKTIVDVLRVNEAFITDRGKLKLGVAAPKVVRDRYIGEYLDWDKDFELGIGSLLYHEPLQADFYEHDTEGFAKANQRYRKIIKKGLKIARRL